MSIASQEIAEVSAGRSEHRIILGDIDRRLGNHSRTLLRPVKWDRRANLYVRHKSAVDRLITSVVAIVDDLLDFDLVGGWS